MTAANNNRFHDDDLERIVETLPPDTQKVFREHQRLATITTRNLIRMAKTRRILLWLVAAQILLTIINLALLWVGLWRPFG